MHVPQSATCSILLRTSNHSIFYPYDAFTIQKGICNNIIADPMTQDANKKPHNYIYLLNQLSRT